jgi:hypothetical protein
MHQLKKQLILLPAKFEYLKSVSSTAALRACLREVMLMQHEHSELFVSN